MKLSSQIASFDHYMPESCIPNYQLEKYFHLKSGWIEKRTGIKARVWAKDGEYLIDLAERAGEGALTKASVSRTEIGLIILATSTPDHLLPPTAPLLAHRLQLSSVCAYDLSGACSGFLSALSMADAFVRTHNQSVLVVAANILSRRLNMKDLDSAILFGDAAGAMVLRPSRDKTKGVLGFHFCTDGRLYDMISIPAGGSKHFFDPTYPSHDYKMKMQNGGVVFAEAIKMMTECALKAMQNAALSSLDITHFIPHQANVRMAKRVAQNLGMAKEKIISIVEQYGNSSAAGILVALSLTHQQKAFIAGEKLLLSAAGAGMMGGAMVLGY